MDRSDNIKVGVRVRPLLERELKAGRCSNWVVSENNVSERGVPGSTYTYDHVFDQGVKTEGIFNTLAYPIVSSVMEGFNGTIFAYGQTSSGKTHTMTGNRLEPGIISLTFDEVFAYIDQHPEREFILAVSYMELYNEKLTDLLDPTNRHLSIQEDSNHKVCVKGLTDQPVTTVEQIAHLLATGESNRSIGETAMNERSSRSHTVFGLTVESICARRKGEGDDKFAQRETEDDDEGTVRVATLNLVDLAGSERASVTGAEGIRFREGTCINKSLLQLGLVISKLLEPPGAHIPFRDSKLTRILQSSLGGNTKTCIICAITPAEVGESHSTLKFASRAMKVRNKPIVNEVLVGEEAYKKKLRMYEKENEALKRKLEQGLPEQERRQLTQQLEQSEKQKAELEARILSLEQIVVKPSADVADFTTKAQRRRTMCAGFPSQGDRVIPAMPGPLSALKETTPVAQRRVTFTSSPFAIQFDRASFERHLDLQEISPVQDRRRTRILGRPSFIPRSSDYLDDTEESSIPQVQTEDAVAAHSSIATQDAECQTDAVASPAASPASDVKSIQFQRSSAKQHVPFLVSTECQTDLELLKLSQDVQQGGAASGSPVHRVEPSSSVDGVKSIQPSGEASFCVHCKDTRGPKGAVEQMETLQFEFDETHLRMQEVEHLLAVKEAELREATMKTEAMANKVGDLEMANQAQEELLMTLQSRLSAKNIKLQQVDQKMQQVLHESEEKSAAQQAAGSELAEVKEQLLILQQKLQKTTQPPPKDSAAVDSQESKAAQLTAKLAEAERMRKEDDLRFQKSYEKMALQTQKACERASALEELLEMKEQQAGTEVANLRTSLDEKTQLIESFRKQLAEAESMRKEDDLRFQERYEEYVSKAEGRVRDLQEQLATAQQAGNEEAVLRASLDEKTQLVETFRKQLAEAGRMRKEDDLRFQKSYEQMALDIQKAREQECALKQQVDAQEQQCTTAKQQLQSLSTEYEEYVSKAEGRVRDLQEQLATSEQAGSAEANLRASLNEKTQLIETFRKQLAEAERMRKEDDLRFQKSYEQMALDIQKAREQECALKQQVDAQEQQCTTAKQQLQSLSAEYKDYVSKAEGRVRDLQEQLATAQQAGTEVANLRTSLDEKTQLIETFRKQLAEAESMRKEDDLRFQKSYEQMALDIQKAREQACALKQQVDAQEQQYTTTKQQLQSLSAEYEDYVSKAEGRVRDLQEQLATAQQAGSAEANLRASLNEKTQLIETFSKQLAEAERMRKEDDLRFQKSYEQMTLDIQKTREQAWALKQQIVAQEHQARASLGEQAQLIESLRDQCTTTKRELQSLSGEYREYVTRMEGSVSDLRKQLATSEQLKSESKSSSEATEHLVRDLRKEVARLRTRIQGQAIRTSESTNFVTDGSGFVTGLALQEMRIDNQLLTRQNDNLQSRVQKIKDEFIAEREKLNGAREELKRYRQERNIFRAKYQGLKDACRCGAVHSDRRVDPSSNPAPPHSTSSASSQPSADSVPLEKLPSPKPPRKSILSLNPDRDLQPERRRFPRAAPVTEPIIPKPVEIRNEDMVDREPENVIPLEPRRHRGWESRPRFIWDETLLESTEEAKSEPQKCQQQ